MDGIRANITIQAQRHVNIVEKHARKDPVVLNWLTGSRPSHLREFAGSPSPCMAMHYPHFGGEGN